MGKWGSGEVGRINKNNLLTPAILSPEVFYYQIIIQMRIFISTGEVSGDLQAAMLIESLFKLAKNQEIELEIFALGGDRMELAGAKMLGKTTRLAAMGLIESIPFILPTLQLQKRAKEFFDPGGAATLSTTSARLQPSWTTPPHSTFTSPLRRPSPATLQAPPRTPWASRRGPSARSP